VASTCVSNLRAGDLFCRWGGEEFIVLLPSTSLAHGCLLAERLRSSVAELVVPGLPQHITMSLGVAELLHGEETLDDVVSNADRRLYLAKDAGRNRVEPSSTAITIDGETGALPAPEVNSRE
jgi:diguanylate cyclase (GGDEF)-like protein